MTYHEMAMKGAYLALVVASGCTPLQPMGLGLNVASGCRNVDCVVDRVNDAEAEKGQRYIWMDGYDEVDLRYMKDHGLLGIHITNPLLVAWGVYGYAEVMPGKYGDVARCNMGYTPSPLWRILVHELSHCKGYTDRFPVMHRGKYTDEQKRIIKEEGKENWTDTDFYKEGKYWVEYDLENNVYKRKPHKVIQ